MNPHKTVATGEIEPDALHSEALNSNWKSSKHLTRVIVLHNSFIIWELILVIIWPSHQYFFQKLNVNRDGLKAQKCFFFSDLQYQYQLQRNANSKQMLGFTFYVCLPWYNVPDKVSK